MLFTFQELKRKVLESVGSFRGDAEGDFWGSWFLHADKVAQAKTLIKLIVHVFYSSNYSEKLLDYSFPCVMFIMSRDGESTPSREILRERGQK